MKSFAECSSHEKKLICDSLVVYTKKELNQRTEDLEQIFLACASACSDGSLAEETHKRQRPNKTSPNKRSPSTASLTIDTTFPEDKPECISSSSQPEFQSTTNIASSSKSSSCFIPPQKSPGQVNPYAGPSPRGSNPFVIKSPARGTISGQSPGSQVAPGTPSASGVSVGASPKVNWSGNVFSAKAASEEKNWGNCFLFVWRSTTL